MNEYDRARLDLKILLMSTEDLMKLADEYADKLGLRKS